MHVVGIKVVKTENEGPMYRFLPRAVPLLLPYKFSLLPQCFYVAPALSLPAHSVLVLYSCWAPSVLVPAYADLFFLSSSLRAVPILCTNILFIGKRNLPRGTCLGYEQTRMTWICLVFAFSLPDHQ